MSPPLPPIPYAHHVIDEDDIRAVARVLTSDALTQGPEVLAFERAVAETVGAKYAVAVSSGTAALHVACAAAGVAPGDTGITSPITFVASANAIRYQGGRPRFADVTTDTALASPEAVAKMARDTRPRVIIPVDFAGAPSHLREIGRIGDEVSAMVIEDAAHALGARYRDADGTWVKAASCTHTDMAILSFHPAKHITTLEGGAVTTNDRALYEELLRYRMHGITRDPARVPRVLEEPWYYEQLSLGWNYRMSDVQAALGQSQLKKLPRFLSRRRDIVAEYTENFACLSEIFVPLAVPAGAESARHLFGVSFTRGPGETQDDVAARRKALYLALRADGIFAQVHYIPVTRQPDFVRHGFVDPVPQADAYYAGALSFPLHPHMTDADVTRVIESTKKFADTMRTKKVAA